MPDKRRSRRRFRHSMARKGRPSPRTGLNCGLAASLAPCAPASTLPDLLQPASALQSFVRDTCALASRPESRCKCSPKAGNDRIISRKTGAESCANTQRIKLANKLVKLITRQTNSLPSWTCQIVAACTHNAEISTIRSHSRILPL